MLLMFNSSGVIQGYILLLFDVGLRLWMLKQVQHDSQELRIRINDL
ncbi:MAG: hypothetical protein M1419_08255 [Bacteroidetes bacterium]|nr:hypothetical protein [Bacteroidota bacterium]